MEFGSFEEFWAALGRLYDANVKNAEEIGELRASIDELRGSVGSVVDTITGLRDSTANLANAVDKLHKVADAHERRPDRHEVTIEAILEDLRRHREGPSPQ
jgi:methyl-accepting chemotaxis protein